MEQLAEFKQRNEIMNGSVILRPSHKPPIIIFASRVAEYALGRAHDRTRADVFVLVSFVTSPQIPFG
jgi:hypothetical protein